MATRKVTSLSASEEGEGFTHVIDEICRGQYVLVLGSDIMLDTSLNQAAEGDSTRFFLDQVIENQKKPGVHYSMEENFSSFILNNNLESAGVRRWLFDSISQIDFELADITPDLLRLLRTKYFRVVLTTIVDPAAETLMDAVWGKGNYRIMNIFNSRNSDFDLETSKVFQDEYFDVPPTLYYVFGKADPAVKELRFVLDDNDTIECISEWLGERAPKHLLSYIDNKKLLVLGCNLKDWCFRFFWYAMRGKNQAKLRQGDIAVLLQPEKSEQDRNLFNYLNGTIKVRLQTDARAYIKRLADALDEASIADTALSLSKRGGVFVSYASEDFAIALNVFNRLRQAGFNVWLDNARLSVADKYDRRIENAISQCRAFVLLLTSTVASDLTADRDRYYRHEWELAAGENDDIDFFPIVTSNYNCRASYHRLIPQKVADVTVFDWVKEPFSVLIEKIASVLKS